MGLVAVVGAVLAVGSTVAGIAQGNKTRRAQEAQNKKISAVNAAKATASRRRAAREARIRQAQLASQAEAGGFAGSSTAISGEGMTNTIQASQSSQIGNALATTNAMSAGNQAIQDSQDRQQLFSNISAIGGTLFQAGGGAEGVEKTYDNLFGSDK